ncbi:MAG TPA: chromosome segregation protein SMC, partial [Anaerolineae bacterium]|nr:chromosome segregation protein SMC [Anaerolineae bacterium]
LKHLLLHGYKTFATRTEFLFDSGITAIVGPNGSGKSNIADGIRWVLGEQSYSLLRAKRSEDMIFSGSESRPRMGMAHVALTFDNSEGWLPIDFQEVVIARRAYRSGENEYFLNGKRVRLRDVTELLAASGLARRTYTVIGQGLIGELLSLRAEDRRVIFEEAAGITGHQRKRDQALTRLAETEANLLRVQDIINEIRPRLRSLERQAQRARQREQVRADLENVLRVWYGHRWHHALQQLEEARGEERVARQSVRQHQQLLQDLEQQLADLQARSAVLRDILDEQHRQSSLLHNQAETIQRDLAIHEERYRLLEQQKKELLQELSVLRARLAAGQERVKAAAACLAEIDAERTELVDRLATAQEALAQQEAKQRQLRQALEAARQSAIQFAADLAAHQNELTSVAQRREELNEERKRLAEAAAAARSQVETALSQLADLTSQERTLQTRLHRLNQQRARLQQQMAGLDQQLADRREELTKAQRDEARLRDRFDLLDRLRSEGAGHREAVRYVLQTSGNGLNGIVGTVASLIRVPPELETAIETALGYRLQNIVVERWADAEAAIERLKKARVGQATFLPLDTIRPGRPLKAPADRQVLGIASELVQADPRLKPVLDLLLGRTLVVSDMSAARRMFQSYQSGPQPTIVTLAGEIVRPGGSLTGGSRPDHAAGSGILAREREWRALPVQIQKAATRCQGIEQTIVGLRSEQARMAEQLTALDDQRQVLKLEEAQLSAQIEEMSRQIERQQQQAQWQMARVEETEQEIGTLAQHKQSLQAKLADLRQRAQEAAEALIAAEAALAQVSSDDLVAEVAGIQAEAKAVAGRWDSQASLLHELQDAQAALQTQIADKETRVRSLQQTSAQLAAYIEQLRVKDTELATRLTELKSQIEPAEQSLVELQTKQEKLEQDAADARRQLHMEESHYNTVALAAQRREDEVNNLRREIEQDLGLVQLEQSPALDDQPPLPLHPLVAALPTVIELPEGIEEEVKRLRSQFNRLGNVNPEAPAEYEETRRRHDFLMEQSADLRAASEQLRRILAELDRVMEQEFLHTFNAVAACFREYFRTLFGGGRAELQLTDPTHPNRSGVEITARPPGKRTQNLALLSGGEQALTAAALIFSILRVKPSPFVILDEVDAALDEANIGRFRDALRELAQQTQFIVITHNRGTIEVADTIYGISMGADGVSRVLSLRLEDAAEAVAA